LSNPTLLAFLLSLLHSTLEVEAPQRVVLTMGPLSQRVLLRGKHEIHPLRPLSSTEDNELQFDYLVRYASMPKLIRVTTDPYDDEGEISPNPKWTGELCTDCLKAFVTWMDRGLG
jgi:hypothetical protein